MNLEKIRSPLIFVMITTLIGCKSESNFSIPADFRLSSMIIPMHYDVKLFLLDIDMGDFSKPNPSFVTDNYDNYFYGSSSITINIFRTTRNIILDILNVDLSNWPELIKRDGLIYEPKNITTKGNLLDLYFSDMLFPGLYHLKIESFGRTTHDNASEGFFRASHRSENGNITWIIATRIQTIGARRLFPCWDNPQIRTTFKISIQHPRNSMALSNMPIRGQNPIDNIKWTYFHTTPPIAACHIAFVVTNYNYVRMNQNSSLWCRECSKNFEFAKLIIKNVTSHLASEFEEVTIPKIDHVAIPNFPQDDTSKLGLIFYGEADIIYNENLDTSMRKINIAHLIAPKIAYQWFGNAVSPSRWSSFWLHDGLATFFGEDAVAKISDNYTITDFFIVQNQYDSLHLDSHFNMNPLQTNNLSETNSLFSFPRYIKVPIILRMLQTAITDEAFRRGVHTYLYKYRFNSVTLYEFLSTLQEIANTYGYHIPKEFLSWISYRHYPVVSWTQRDGELAQNFNVSSYGKWCIPINLIVETTVTSENVKLWLTQQNPNFNINIHLLHILDWVIVDVQQSGYYRVNYGEKNWYKISRYLNSFIFRNITVINRAKIIDDAFHLTITRQLNISVFWDLTNHLWHDTNFVAWYPMFKIFEYVSNVLPFYKHSTGITIKQKLSDLIEHAFKILRYVYIEENDFLKCMKSEILRWACMLRHGPCLTMAKEKLLWHLAAEEHLNIDSNRDSNRVTPEWKEWVYCKGLQEANITVWNILKTKWLKDDHKLLPYLACTGDSTIILEWLPYVQWNPSTNTTQDPAIIRSYINIFHAIIAKHANNYTILANTLLILKKIKPKEISMIVALTDIINHVYSEKHLTKIRQQIEQQQYVTDIEQVTKIQHKIQLRSSEIRNQVDYFQFIHN